jgi:transmembrane sensor
MDYNILHRYLLGNASLEEKEKVVQWVDEDPKHKEELTALGWVYDAAIWFQDNKEEKSSLPHQSHQGRVKHLLIASAKIAAVFVLGFLLDMIIQWNNNKVSMLSFYSPMGQRSELTLADGTRVFLNSASSLRFPNRFSSTRKVELNGSAYFEVTHNSKSPFIVSTKEAYIKVLGTKFNVYAYASNDKFTVSLLEGVVNVSDKKKPSNVVQLRSKESLSLVNGEFIKTSFDDTDSLLWLKGICAFDNMPFSILVDKLEVCYGVTIIQKNHKLAQYRLCGKFRQNDGIDNVLKTLQQVYHFTYIKDESNNLITIY